MSQTTAASLIADPINQYPFATVACFDPTMGELPRRQLDVNTNGTFLEKLANANASAVLIGASTGHGHVRTVDELKTWFETAAKASIGDMVLMALLRPEDGIKRNQELLALLRDVGYQVVFFRPGTDLKPDATDSEVVQSMRPLIESAAQLDLAIGLYSIPDVSGLPLSANAAAELRRGPGGENIVAVKVTEAQFETSTKLFLEHAGLDGLKIVQGWDTHMAKAIELGGARCGVTSGPMSFAIFQYLHIFAAAAKKAWVEVAKAQSAVTQLFQAMQDDPGKFADLQRAKVIMGLGQPLTSQVEEDQIERVFAALDKVPRLEDRQRLARSLDLMNIGPFHKELRQRYS